MTLSTDPQYRRLAAATAAALGATSPDITRAILAQWQCELGNRPYPPARNNPGNLARGFAKDTGIPYTVALGSNPQPSNPIVTFATPELGAAAYAAGIRSFSRYRATLAAARAGNGAAFLKAITSAGWGTGYGCAIGVYNQIGGTGTAPGGSLPGAGSTVAATIGGAPGDLAALLGHDGVMTGANAHQITVDAAAAADRLVTAGTVSASWAVNAKNLIGTKAVGVAHGGGVTIPFREIRFAADGGSPGLIPDVGGAIGRGVVLLFILAGVLMGAWLLFRQPAELVLPPGITGRA